MTGIRLTLYQNCILNDKYKNVFSQQVIAPNYQSSPFSSYLDNLTKKQFTLDEVYSDEMTFFTFSLSSSDYLSIYLFNYMKIESIVDDVLVLTRYAFITNIKIGNEIAKVSYKIDVWHSYCMNISGMNMSYLKGLRVINGTGGLITPSYKSLPIDYAGNNILVFPTHTYGDNADCLLIAEIQSYEGTRVGEPTLVETKYVLIQNNYSIDEETHEITNVFFKFSEIEKAIRDLIHATQYKSFKQDYGTQEEFYFTLGKVYILPYVSELETKFTTVSHTEKISYYYNGDTEHEIIVGYWRPVDTNSSSYKIYNPTVLYTKTYSNNYKRLSVGLFSKQIPVINNGTSLTVKITCCLSETTFKLFLNTQNKILDITNEFYYEPLENYLSGTTLAQQRISRILQNYLLAINTAQTINTGISNTAKGVGQIAEGIFGTGGISSIVGGAVNIQDALVNTSLNITKNALKRKALNEPVYNSNSYVSTNNIALLNAKILICDFVLTADNTNYVKSAINNSGYNVYEYLNNFSKLAIHAEATSFTSNNIYYNIVQLGIADLYGSFPDNIAKELNKILENGIKIWYYHDISYALAHDNYAVG